MTKIITMMKKIYRINRRIASIICFSLLLLGNVARSAEIERDFVLFIYMNGSDLESKNQLATHNINAMHSDQPDDH